MNRKFNFAYLYTENNVVLQLRFWFLGAVLFVMPFRLSAQDDAQVIDSAWNYLQQIRARQMSDGDWKQLSEILQRLPPEKADSVVDFILSDNKNLSMNIIGKLYDFKGLLARKQNLFSRAVENHQKALYYLKYTDDTLARIKANNNLGVALHKLNMENLAFKYFMRAKSLADAIGHKKSQAIAIHGIANVFIDLGDYRRALQYLRRSLDIERSLNNSMGVEYNYSNFAEAYTYLKQFDSAKYYLDKSIELAKKLYDGKLGVEYNLMGKYYFYKGDYPEAVRYYKMSLADVENRNVERYVANGYIMMGRALEKMGKVEEAKKYLTKGLETARRIKSRENIILALEALSDYYRQRGNFARALDLQKQKETYKDSMVNLHSLQNINSLEILNKVKEKEAYIRRLAREKEQARRRSKRNSRIALGIGIASILLMTLLWYVFWLKRRNTELELEELNREIHRYILEIENLKNKQGHANESQAQMLTFKLAKEFELTRRQEDILRLIIEGNSNNEIAEKLHISANTVKTHLRHIYEKLNVRNRREILQKMAQTASPSGKKTK